MKTQKRRTFITGLGSAGCKRQEHQGGEEAAMVPVKKNVPANRKRLLAERKAKRR